MNMIMHAITPLLSKRLTILSLCFVLLGLYAPQAKAETAGHVTQLQGQVTRNGSALSQGSAIDSSDTIKTGDNSKVIFKMVDGATVELGKNSELKLSEYHYQQGGAGNSVIMEVMSGFFRTLSGAVGKSKADHYQVKTPLSSIGIQGTNYQVLVNNAEKKEFIGARQGVIIVEEIGIIGTKTALLGDKQKQRFLRMKAPAAGTRAMGVEWEKFAQKPHH
jgi:hypothetical protein